MVCAAKKVAEKYSWISHSGCQCHGLNLGCKDICNTKLFKLLIGKCNQILNFFRHKHGAAALSKAFENQKMKEKKFQVPVTTRFATNYTSIKSIKYAKLALREAVNYPSLDRQNNVAAIRKIINDPKFWEKLDETILVLKPLSLAIFKLEKNLIDFGEGRNVVKLAFIETLNKVEHSKFNNSFKALLTKAIEKRHKFCSNDLDYVYSLLDPRQRGGDLTPKERQAALKKIDQLKKNPRIKAAKLDRELRVWVEKGGMFMHDAYPEAWESLGSEVTPKQWWKLYFNETELSTIMSMILATPIASAASERTWSMRGFVHSKARNRLAVCSADKLVFLKYNLALKKKFLKKREKSRQDEDTDDEAPAAIDNESETSLIEEDFDNEYDLQEAEFEEETDSMTAIENDQECGDFIANECDFLSSSSEEDSDNDGILSFGNSSDIIALT